MAKFICDSGTLTFVGSSISAMCLNNVTIDIAVELVDYQCMADVGNWQSAASGTKSWTCSFETALDDTVGIDLANTVGVEAVLTFDTVDGLAYSGLAIITGSSINAPVDDYATVSWEATGNGPLTES